MSTLSPLGARQYQNSALAGGQQTSKSSSTAQSANSSVSASSSSKLSSNVALSPGSVDLQKRVDKLGNDTLDLAQHFLGSFAQKLFGDDAKGATIAFDSVSLESSSTMSAGLLRSQGSEGVMNAGAFSLEESSHFIGKGTITMADGSKYDFEVEVQYDISTSAGVFSNAADASSEAPKSDREKLIEQNPAMPLPAIEFPDIEWPGSLGDLFKLMDKQASGDVQDGESGQQLGTLSVRLLNLVNSARTLDSFASGKTGAKAYAAELAASAAGKNDATAATGSTAAGTTATGTTETGTTAPEPVADAAATETRSATEIPPTVSTGPKEDPAA